MSRLLPQPDLSKLERIGDLTRLKRHLRNKDPSLRFQCLFSYSDDNKYCLSDCQKYDYNHRILFKNATTILLKDAAVVDEQDFLQVMRTLFCGDHDPSKSSSEYRNYGRHLEALWEGASKNLKDTTWDTLRTSGRNIHPPSTPQRPTRDQDTHANSAPVVPRFKVEIHSDETSSPPPVDGEAITRPQTAQPKLGRSANFTARAVSPVSERRVFGQSGDSPERDCELATPSPSPLPTRRMAALRGVKHKSSGNRAVNVMDQPEPTLIRNKLKKSSGVSDSDDVGPVKEKPTHELSSASHSHQEDSKAPPVSQNSEKKFRAGMPSSDFKFTFMSGSRSPESNNATPAGQSPFVKTESPDHIPLPQAEPRLSPSPVKSPAPASHIYDTRTSFATAMKIRDILLKDIVPTTGAIYVLEAPAFFSNFPPAQARNEQWVKIGISSDVDKRIKQLKARCGITDLVCVYRSDAKSMTMDLVRRIELLCHEELNDFRRKMDCKNNGVRGAKCDVIHTEWFALDKDIAMKTVKRWRQFLSCGPYGKYGVLDDFWRGRLDAGKYRVIEDDVEESDHESEQKRLQAWFEKSFLAFKRGL